MDQREQSNDATEALQAAFDGRQARLWTAMPGIIQSFDPAKMTCTVRVALLGLQTKKDGTQIPLQIPLLVDCPVVFPSGGGYILTFPLAEGDECLAVFASRCIDAWWQSGGVQKQQELRLHDLSDGFVIPGPRSVPHVPENISTDGVELRSLDRSIYVRVAADQITLKHPTKVVADTAELHCTGKITSVGDMVSDTEVKVGTHTLTQHHHTQPNDSHGDVEQPTNTPTG